MKRLLPKGRTPTLLLRCILLIAASLAANLVLWIVSIIVFTKRSGSDRSHLLSLCLFAWTLGLRHGLDADHISVIDNATRRIVSLPTRKGNRMRKPVTCGLFFSLGHSTIVLSVLIAVAISTSIVNKLGGVGEVGGIIGASVSGSFLFLFGVINSVLLFKSIRAARRRRLATAVPDSLNEEKATPAKEKEEAAPHEEDEEKKHFRGIFTRMALPLLRMVDRPYKLYPIGILFGFGFDTASSIALLGVAAATNMAVIREDGEPVASAAGEAAPSTSDAAIVLLALLFMAGMTLVDSCDSILMVNAYAPGELKVRTADGRTRWALFESPSDLPSDPEEGEGAVTRMRAPPATATAFSHLITFVSILLAFVISLITILGLIGENCARCSRAADKQQAHEEDRAGSPPGGLEGRWWLFWRRCNDQSGIIGAAIVGGFAACLLAWYLLRLLRRRRSKGSVTERE